MVRLSESLQLVDMKIQVFDLPYQVCQTKDNKNIHLTLILYYHIFDAYKATFKIGTLRHALEQHVQMMIQELLREKKWDNLTRRTEDLCKAIIDAIKDQVKSWGVEVE